MRMNVPTGVCRSASTERTTGTTLPCRASRSNASNDGGWRSNIRFLATKKLKNKTKSEALLFVTYVPLCGLTSYHTIARQPLAAINYQNCSVDKTRGAETDETRGFLDVGKAPETSEWNIFSHRVLDRPPPEPLPAFRVFDWAPRY